MVDLRACPVMAAAAILTGCTEVAATATASGDQLAARYRDCWARLAAAEGCHAVDDAARALSAELPGAGAVAELVLVNGRELAGVVRLRSPAGARTVFHRAELDPDRGSAREWWLVAAGADQPGRAPSTAVAAHDDRELHHADAHRRLALLFSDEDPAAFDRLDDALPGRAALVGDVRAAWSALDTTRVEIGRSWAAGDHTVLTGQLRAVTGSSRDDRRVLDLAFAHVIEWRGGRAVASHLVVDDRELDRQLDAATAVTSR